MANDTPTTKANVLVVDDEEDHAQVMCEALTRQGHKCDVTYNLAEAKSKLDRKPYDVVVTDLMMDGRKDGLEVLAASKHQNPPPPVILVTAHGDIPTAVKAMNEGAHSFIEKPLDLEYFRAQVSRAAERAALQKQNQALQEQVVDLSGGFEGMIGQSQAMQRVVQTARQVAPSDIPVLILGENGTGKELVARAIHAHSKRRKGRLVAMNCAGFAPTILEDELFGHVRGAFTDARTDREGRFEHADGGTLFMDEIGNVPVSQQAKLLRIIESGEFERIGSSRTQRANVRIVTATNANLADLVTQGRFRQDLLFRLNTIEVRLPPLRERQEDIIPIAYRRLAGLAAKYGRRIEGFDDGALQVLRGYSWPGNVRELGNVIERAVLMTRGAAITATDLRLDMQVSAAPSIEAMSLEDAERLLIRTALRRAEGNVNAAAEALGLSRSAMYRRLEKLGIRTDGL